MARDRYGNARPCTSRLRNLGQAKSDDVEADLAATFAQAGLRLRNESHSLGRTTLQDLLSDEFARIAIGLFRLGSTQRAPDAWQICSAALSAVRALADGDDITEARTDAELTAFLATMRAEMRNTPDGGECHDPRKPSTGIPGSLSSSANLP